jgi:hypothetical protein
MKSVKAELTPTNTLRRTPTGSMRTCSCWAAPSPGGDDRNTYGPGDLCSLPAGTLHEEHIEVDGVRYVSGRRPASPAAAAE